MKETAVEWLVEQCPRIETIVAYNILEQAKEMEKQQIINAYQKGFNNAYFNNPLSKEQYYNETFKSE
jgi:hypothetical protein